MIVAGVIGSTDLEAGRDHGPVFPHHPGVAVQLDAHQLALRRDVLDHGGGVLQRQPHFQLAVLRRRRTGRLLASAEEHR
jgi:hypothetical protein